jgi:CMP-N-acetylneuraminic acid synthetase
MNKPKITALVPCRKGSQRVANKNTRPFCGFAHGLLEIKLQQLAAVPSVDEIVVSTNDTLISDYVQSVQHGFAKPLLLDISPEEFAADDAMQAFIGYLGDTLETDVIAWTHVTSPLFNAHLYEAALAAYHKSITEGSSDSLMAVDSVQTFAIKNGVWISHDSNVKRWPRTQDLDKIHLVNSALFVIERNLMTKLQDRVGFIPFLFETPFPHGFDIDWEEDFAKGEELYYAFGTDSLA